MATINYRIKKGEDKSNNSIYVRFRTPDLDVEKSMGITVKSADWNSEKQMVRNTKSSASNYQKINSKLDELRNHILERYNEQFLEGVAINKHWFVKELSKFLNQALADTAPIETYFIPYVKQYIEKSPTKRNPRTGNLLSKRTIQDYEGTLRKLEHYSEVNSLNLKHTDISLDFHSKFLKYCEEYRKIKPKTIGGEISNIKLFIKNAELDGYKVNQDYKRIEFNLPDNKTTDFALTFDEMSAIYNLDLSNDKAMDNARDWFVIGLWTGLRISDILSLTAKNIIDGFIQIENFKTGIYVIIPIREEVQCILNKRNGAFPSKISDQNFNIKIKTICQLTGLTEIVKGEKQLTETIIDYDGKKKKAKRKIFGNYPKFELVSSHICRRSFATYHYGKIDTLSIMRITGHATEKQFIDYVKIPPIEHAKRMREFWNTHYITDEQQRT